jgi:hypothetical protein
MLLAVREEGGREVHMQEHKLCVRVAMVCRSKLVELGHYSQICAPACAKHDMITFCRRACCYTPSRWCCYSGILEAPLMVESTEEYIRVRNVQMQGAQRPERGVQPVSPS